MFHNVFAIGFTWGAAVTMSSSSQAIFRALFVVSVSAAATLALVRSWKKVQEASRAGRIVESGAQIVLAIDIGSSSVRCSAYTVGSSPSLLSGCTVQIKHAVVDQDNGTADAQKVVELVEAAVDQCFGKLRARKVSNTVVAVGFACFGMNLVGVDAGGYPCTPVFTYANSSPGNASTMRRLRESLERTGRRGTHGLEDARQRTGAPTHVSYAPVQLLEWLTRTVTSSGEKIDEKESRSHKSKPRTTVKTWQTLPSLIAARWCCLPSVPVSYSEASWMGLLDFRRLEWDDYTLSVLRDAGFDCSALPRLADVGDLRSGVTGAALERWPELDRASIRLGVGDGAAACLGSGCDEGSGLISVTIGTSAAARVVLPLGSTASAEVESESSGVLVEEAFRVPKGLWCYRVDRKRVVLGGALTDGGSVFEWVRKMLVLTDGAATEEVLREVRDMPPTSHRLVMLPFFSGERSPGYKDDARACILGLKRSTTRAQLVRAALESVCLRLAVIVDLMAGAGSDTGPDNSISTSSTLPLDASSARGVTSSVALRTMNEGSTANEAGLAMIEGTEVLPGTGEAATMRDTTGAALVRVSKVRRDSQVVTSGQALAASPLWRQILADSLERVVHPSRTSEETSLGVAIMLSSLENENLPRCHGQGASPELTSAQAISSKDSDPVGVHMPDRAAALAYRAAGVEQQRAYRVNFDAGLPDDVQPAH